MPDQEIQSDMQLDGTDSSIAGEPTPAATDVSDSQANLKTIPAEIESLGCFTPHSLGTAVEEGSERDCDSRQSNRAVGPTTSDLTSLDYYASLISSPYPKTRFLPNSTSSFLKPNSKFTGTQQSDRQIYEVSVEIKHVDMAESFLCGYLRIQGLTDDHPTLTTYFEGEIIGTKYTFQTKHAEWGSSEKVDMAHWARFPAWRPLSKQAKKPDFSYKNFAQRENIFMRWKEYFLVPDHRVRTISGASFEGFYYICFNQVTGSISGIYYHAKSEKYGLHPLRMHPPELKTHVF
jgi:hypothetical protein